MRYTCALVGLFLSLALGLSAQHRVDPRWSYSRAIIVAPLQGAGTAADPLRPKHAPAPQAVGPSQPPAQPGIIAFTFVPSDDGKYAIAEFVALNRTALSQILADRTAGVLVFEKGATKAADIEAAIRPFRKDFSLQNFGVPIQ
jgi:hypothetical protein